MGRDAQVRALMVAEGSGGHLIPALQVAGALTRGGVAVKVWYPQRPQMAMLTEALARDAASARVEVEPIRLSSGAGVVGRFRQSVELWRRAQRCFTVFSPNVVVGFGGWASVPVILAAHRRGVACLLHEQNVTMGRANRLLARWVDRVAVSFPSTQSLVQGRPSLVTGMPVRERIGCCPRTQAAARFGFMAELPTLLVLGGSQGARVINRMMLEVIPLLSERERRHWQVVHVTGPGDADTVRAAYDAAGLTAWVAPFLYDMEAAYAHADIAIARAGASTIAELARCGVPAVLIPYPHASGHQRANAQLAESMGGAVMMEEGHATPERLLGAVKSILTDSRLRGMMAGQMRALQAPGAARQVAEAVAELAQERMRKSLHWVPAVSGAAG